MIKETLARALPRSWVHFLKKLYFPGVLRNVTEKDWPYARIVQHLVRPGDRVIDVGANIGYVTSLLSRYVGPDGRVFSFEPVPETHALLAHSLQKLAIGNVETFRCALSSEPGTAVMEIPHFPEGGENFYQSHIVDDGQARAGRRAVSVELRRLDDVLSEHLDSVAFMKIDVEGHELAVLGGARALLERSRPALIVEVSGNPDDQDGHAAPVFALLAEFAYSAWVLDGAGVRPRRSGESAVDYFFLMPGHIERLEEHGATTS